MSACTAARAPCSFDSRVDVPRHAAAPPCEGLFHVRSVGEQKRDREMTMSQEQAGDGIAAYVIAAFEE
jgi:hypothetical protein